MTATVQSLLQEARDFILADKLEEGEAKQKQAVALKALEDDIATRRLLPAAQADAPEQPIQGAEDMAVKAAYVKRFGEMDSAVTQIMRELYQTDNYAKLRAMKMASINHYIRTPMGGHPVTALDSMVLLTPDQIMSAVWGGVPVSSGQHSIKATMVEAQDTLGGVLVPEEINQDLVQRLPGLTVVRSRARKYNTSRDALSFLVRTGGGKRFIGAMRSKNTSESPTAGSYSTNATWGKINIPVHVNLSKVPVSKSLLEDASMDIMREVLMPEFTAEAAINEDRMFLIGSGADEAQGILAPTSTAAPPNTDIATQVTGSASALTFDSLVNTPFNIAGQYRQKKSASVAWAFTSTTAGLIAQLKDGTGRYLWSEMMGNNSVGNPDTLRGWAYAETEAMPEVAANVYAIIFGDFDGYRIVDRIGVSIQRYDDSALADTDSVAFYCRRRFGGQVAEGWRFVVVQAHT